MKTIISTRARKWQAKCIILISLCCWLPAQDAQVAKSQDSKSATVDDCKITITSDRPKYEPSEPIKIAVELKNTSNVSLIIEDIGNERNYLIEVKNQNGEIMPKTRYATVIEDPLRFYKNVKTVLEPGQLIKSTIIINRFRDMTVRDWYDIRVSRNVGSVSSGVKHEITSEGIVVGVDDPSGEPASADKK